MPTLRDGVLIWGSDIDEGAILQAGKAARLPFMGGHVALMPDAHIGMGATIGSVLPTQGAIIPSAVGVDLGCVDAETEFLSPEGWRRMDSWSGEKVAQYHPETGMAEFVEPLRYIQRPQDEFLWFKTKYGIDQRLTDDHRVLRWALAGRDRHEVMQVVSAAEHVAEHERLALGSKVRFETAFRMISDRELPLDDDELRVQVMVMADGHLDTRSNGSSTVTVRLVKQRKIERARKLLDEANITFTEHSSDGVTRLRFTAPLATKTYATFWAASPRQCQVIADECLQWDGNEKDRVFFTRDKASADFIHYCFANSGWRSVMRSDEHKDGGIDYRVFRHANTKIAMAGSPKSPIVKVPSSDGFAYCFSVPSGFLVLRRGGNIFTTGNCGMTAAQTELNAKDLPDGLSKLFSAIASKVPAGVGKGHASPKSGLANALLDFNKLATDLTPKQEQTAVAQFGTLGSGNHFVEVCLDETDTVWVVLHSGSRGIGNQLARQHIEKAKGLMKQYFVKLEDPDLAYFVEGTPEFDSYITDMMWAQNYAAQSRSTMLASVVDELRKVIGLSALETRTINCHHNYTEKERHHGKDLWLTRKGAIRAREGDLGIIPGSMGTIRIS